MPGAIRRADTDMTTGSIMRHLIAFSVPLLIGNIFQQLYNTVDSVVVGNFVGKQALAAVGSVAPIINMLIGFFTGFATGAGVLISRYFGAHERENVHKAVQTTIALTIILSVALSVVGVWMTPLMLRAMQTPDDVIVQAEEYLRIYFAGLSGLLLYNCLLYTSSMCSVCCSTVTFPRTLQITSTTASARRATRILTTPSFLTAMRSRPEMTSSKRKAFSFCRASCFACLLYTSNICFCRL